MSEIVEIVVITYAIIEVLKQIRNFKSEAIPAMAGVIGGLLGIVCYHFISDFPANNIVTAIAIGIVSGLASTGGHQIIKQIRKESNNE